MELTFKKEKQVIGTATFPIAPSMDDLTIGKDIELTFNNVTYYGIVTGIIDDCFTVDIYE